jgi:hypothetical protein
MFRRRGMTDADLYLSAWFGNFAPQAPFVDDPAVREVYADVVQVLPMQNGVIGFELSAQRHSKVLPIRVERIDPVARFACRSESAIADAEKHSIAHAEKHSCLCRRRLCR